MITVYHNDKFLDLSFEHNIAKAFKDKMMNVHLRKVADVDTNSLDDAFRLTNHISDSWTKNEEVNAAVVEPRSTSVGDVMEKDGKQYIVAMSGFEEME